mgnify:CR=1 FL=1
MNFDFDVRVSLTRQGTRLRESTLVHELIRARARVLATGAVPDDSLHLARARVASAACVPIPVASSREIVIAVRSTTALLL